MDINNGRLHDSTGQHFLSELSNCSYYFDSDSNENRLKGIFGAKEFVAFCLSESKNSVNVYATIPDGYECIHYKKGCITSSVKSIDAHLTYHGSPKRKKITGEIHVVTNLNNPLKGQSSLVEAPLAGSSNILIHPLPICRIELSANPGELNQQSKTSNYFHVNTPACYFNTLEVHLARKGYLYNVASASQTIPGIWASVFINVSLHAYFLGKLERRPGNYPQALCLQTKQFELIVLATREYKNPSYEKNTVRYFFTKDYFRDLGVRSVIGDANGWFIDQVSGGKQKPGSKLLSDFL
ncbi:MAG: hypothetical protein EOM46_16855 [Gammaproteobacteria bacterium]|nr:hypothetical protein [Gammaproteobacteria bacterium]